MLKIGMLINVIKAKTQIYIHKTWTLDFDKDNRNAQQKKKKAYSTNYAVLPVCLHVEQCK